MMNVFLSIKYQADNGNRVEIEALTRLLVELGHTVFCVVRDLERWGEVSLTERDLMQQTFQHIRESQLVLVETSQKGVGLGIEAGYAHAVGIRVVAIAREGCELSATLRGLAEASFYYRGDADLKIFLANLPG